MTENQLELFGKLKNHVFEDGLECNNCGLVKPLDSFTIMPSGEIKRKCKSCAKSQAELIKQLKKENPYPSEDYACPICQRKLEEIGKKGQMRLQNWVLDHCHDTEKFRGWVCHHCNTGLGAFKDSVDRLKRAVKYLEDS